MKRKYYEPEFECIELGKSDCLSSSAPNMEQNDFDVTDISWSKVL